MWNRAFWVLFLGFFATVYIGGWQAQVMGTLQRGILMTGLFNSSPASKEKSPTNLANYNLKLEDLEGNPVSLQDFKGKTVFLNFWATWCPPCVAEMPGIEALYQQTKDNPDIAFVMVSVDRKEDKAHNYMRKKAYKMPVYFARSSVPSQYSTGSIPTTFVIDKEGYVVYEKKGMHNYNTNSFKEWLEQQ